jgi:HPt (histidine-containing phosphotransfer) domain-containing protein
LVAALVADCGQSDIGGRVCELQLQSASPNGLARRITDVNALANAPARMDALLDPDAIAVLSEEVGAGRVGSVLVAFCDELTRRVPLVEAAIATRDAGVLMRETHSIKGSALAFGASALGEAASRANASGRAQDVNATVEGARNVLALIHPTLAAIQQLDAYRKERPSP